VFAWRICLIVFRRRAYENHHTRLFLKLAQLTELLDFTLGYSKSCGTIMECSILQLYVKLLLSTSYISGVTSLSTSFSPVTQTSGDHHTHYSREEDEKNAYDKEDDNQEEYESYLSALHGCSCSCFCSCS
jgi:hypothetical protein